MLLNSRLNVVSFLGFFFLLLMLCYFCGPTFRDHKMSITAKEE